MKRKELKKSKEIAKTTDAVFEENLKLFKQVESGQKSIEEWEDKGLLKQKYL